MPKPILNDIIKPYKLTIDDWHQMIAAGMFVDRRVEFIDGEIVELSPEGAFHSLKVDTVSDRLKKVFGDSVYVRVAHPVTLGNWEPEPDISLVKPPYKNYYERNPASKDILLLIEILDSTLNYDLSVKAQKYAENNIQEYWVADIKKKVMHIHQKPQQGKYQIVFDFTEGDCNILALPNVDFNLDLFWQD